MILAETCFSSYVLVGNWYIFFNQAVKTHGVAQMIPAVI